MRNINDTLKGENLHPNANAGHFPLQRKIQEDPMNTRISSSFVRRLSLAVTACALVGVFWYTATARSLVAPVSEPPANPVSVEMVLNGDPDFAPDSVEYAMEKEFYLPHLVDISAGSHFIPQASSMHSENSPDIGTVLSGKPTQCNIRAHGAVALNDVQGCR